MNKVVLIGGAPTNGKSYIARKLGEELKLPWISTDSIREAMRKIVRQEDYPALFHFIGEEVSIEDYLKSHTPQQMIDGHISESAEVWKGVKAFMETDYVWEEFIVEGIAVMPSLLAELDKETVEVLPIFIVDEDKERVKNVVYTRGLWDDANTYSDEVKPIEVEWAMLYSQYIKTECEKYGFKPYIIGDREEFLANLIDEVNTWLSI